MARTRTLMSMFPNIQLVLSNANRYGGLIDEVALTEAPLILPINFPETPDIVDELPFEKARVTRG